MSALKKKFQTEGIFEIKKKLDFSSTMQVPRLEKIMVSVGCGDATKDKKFLESSFNELQLITSQKPLITKSKKSVSEFKLREGQEIGLKVTLRNNLMWFFLEKLFKIALPRTRDFKGINPKSFDKQGNLTIGIKEQIIFTEIHYDNIKKIRGMNITFVTSTTNDLHAKELLTYLGCPFNNG